MRALRVEAAKQSVELKGVIVHRWSIGSMAFCDVGMIAVSVESCVVESGKLDRQGIDVW